MFRTHALWMKLGTRAALACVAGAAIMALGLALFAMPGQAHAEPSTSKTYTVDNVVYRPSKSGSSWYAVVYGCKDKSSITVPETVKIDGETMSVEAVFPQAFMQKASLKTLTIKAPIEYLPTAMCSGDSKLEKVIVPNTVTEINDYVFNGCSSLKSVSDLTNVRTVGPYAFQYCTSLGGIYTFNLVRIGAYAFNGCSALQYICDEMVGSANADLKYIKDHAFYGCAKLTHPGYMRPFQEIGDYAFAYCSSLDFATMRSVKSIGAGAFEACSALGSVTIGETCESVGESAFSGCTTLKRIELPASLKTLGASTFEGCTSLKRLDIANDGNLQSLPKWMCKGCTSLTYVRLPESVNGSIADGAFQGANLRQAYIVNTGVSFADNPFAGCKNFSVIGYTGSTAETFADQHDDIDFIPIDTLAIHKISFLCNNEHAIGVMASTSVYDGEDFVVPANKGFSRPGYFVSKWRESGNSNVYYEPGDIYHNVRQDLTFAAIWKEGHTVTLKGTGKPDEAVNYPLGTAFTIPEGPADSESALFKDWFVEGTDWFDAANHYQPGQEYGTLKSDLTLVAQWTYPTTVRLEANGGTFADGTSSMELKTNRNGGLGEFPEVTCDGYDLRYWQVYDSSSHNYKPVDVTTVLNVSNYKTTIEGKQVIRLMAVWMPSTPRQIVLDLNGGAIDGSEDPILLATDAAGRLMDSEILKYVPERPDYDFAGWQSSTGRILMPGGYSTYSADEMFTAKWNAIGGAALAEVDEGLTSYAKNADLYGSSFMPLRLKAAKVKAKSITLKWKKVAGAAQYVVYGAQSSGKRKLVKLATLGGGKAKYVWKKLSGKKLKKGKYYKAVVVAFNGSGRMLAMSKMVHAATSGGKAANPKKVTTKAKKSKVKLKAGKSFKLRGKAVGPGKGKKVKNCRGAAVLYESSNEAVATVTSKGVVKGVSAGTCYVYAFAQNGAYKRVKVTVTGGTALKAAS